MREHLPGDVLDNVIPEVRALGAYTLKATEAPIKLNQNESPHDIGDAFKARVLERTAARAWNRYPDFHPADVLEGLGALHGLSGRNVLLGNGSNELIQAVLSACVGQGQPVAHPVPTFTLYAMMIRANQGEARAIPLRPDLGYDLPRWEEEARRGQAHLLLCSPNNPTGSRIGPEDVDALCAATRRLVIVDEAYAQFGTDDHSALLRRHPNLVVLRTFSKAIGLAGVRLGYALADEGLVREIGKVKLPYNVGQFGLEVIRAVLEEPDLLEGHAAALRDAREGLRDALGGLPFETVYPGCANFVLVRTPHAEDLFQFLFARGILVRDVGRYPMLDHCLRISIGTEAENTAVIAGITEFFATLPDSP